VYPKALGLTYIDTLLQAVSSQFSDHYGERIARKASGIPQLKDWDVQFEALLQTIEDQDALVSAAQAHGPRIDLPCCCTSYLLITLVLFLASL